LFSPKLVNLVDDNFNRFVILQRASEQSLDSHTLLGRKFGGLVSMLHIKALHFRWYQEIRTLIAVLLAAHNFHLRVLIPQTA